MIKTSFVKSYGPDIDQLANTRLEQLEKEAYEARKVFSLIDIKFDMSTAAFSFSSTTIYGAFIIYRLT